MSLPLTILLLAAWSFAMYRYGRSILFPPALLALVWTVTFLALWLCGTLYYPVGAETLHISIAGIVAFSFGGFVALRVPKRHGMVLSIVPSGRRAEVRRIVRLFPVLLVANFPFFLLYLSKLSGTVAPREGLWRQIRIASIRANATGGGLHIESSLLPFISLAAFLAVFEWADSGENRTHTLTTLLLAGVYHLINGSRSDLLLLMVVSVTIYWIRRGKAPTRALAIATLMFASLFVVNQVGMGKFGADSKASFSDNLPRVLEGSTTYWLGGIVAFDQFRQNPQLKYGWDLSNFAIRLANKFGAGLQEHDRNLQYTKVSAFQITNVYSVFLPYYMQTNSTSGVLCLMAAVGLISTYIYRQALTGSCWAVFTIGTILFSVLMTIFSDEFFAQITFMLKMAAFSTMVYFLPPLVRAKRVLAESTVPSELGLCE